MKAKHTILIQLLLFATFLIELQGQTICIKMRNNSEFSYPINCIRKITFVNKQLILNMISPNPIIIEIDSIQKIKFNLSSPLTINNSVSNFEETLSKSVNINQSMNVLVSSNRKEETE